MDIKPVNQINFDYNGKHYCLEYTRDSVVAMESAGFDPANYDTKRVTTCLQLWAGAFMAHHKTGKDRISDNVIEKLYKLIDNKEELLANLFKMYNATAEYVLLETEDNGDEGNVIKWTATM